MWAQILISLVSNIVFQGNPMFPEGVIYEGVGDEKPQYFRGESGANDSMYVPSFYLTFVTTMRNSMNCLGFPWVTIS